MLSGLDIAQAVGTDPRVSFSYSVFDFFKKDFSAQILWPALDLNSTCMLIYQNRSSKMKFFGIKELFFVNSDPKNGWNNVFQDNKEKSCSWFENRVSLKKRYKSRWDSRVPPDNLRLKIIIEAFWSQGLKAGICSSINNQQFIQFKIFLTARTWNRNFTVWVKLCHFHHVCMILGLLMKNLHKNLTVFTSWPIE